MVGGFVAGVACGFAFGDHEAVEVEVEPYEPLQMTHGGAQQLYYWQQ